ncbi:hypothetical protein M0R04_15980 [Candidatus Dojkabacteria bacterium]|jgi:hypothetical protein|nr:hypothetical protein [Candidatus Dojkabacteria bacterium]
MEFQTPLCELAYKYRTDKCPQINHSYTPFYYELLKEYQQSFTKVVELGVGGHRMVHGTVKDYKPGASLFMWRDFFPNAMIYGGDIDPITVMTDYRIQTFLCDETKPEDLKEFIRKTGSDIDLFVDDALHDRQSQINTALTILPLIKKEAIYIVEDAAHSRAVARQISKSSSEYQCEIYTFHRTRNDRLVVVRKV